jgi:hypothetical protein
VSVRFNPRALLITACWLAFLALVSLAPSGSGRSPAFMLVTPMGLGFIALVGLVAIWATEQIGWLFTAIVGAAVLLAIVRLVWKIVTLARG